MIFRLDFFFLQKVRFFSVFFFVRNVGVATTHRAGILLINGTPDQRCSVDQREFNGFAIHLRQTPFNFDPKRVSSDVSIAQTHDGGFLLIADVRGARRRRDGWLGSVDPHLGADCNEASGNSIAIVVLMLVAGMTWLGFRLGQRPVLDFESAAQRRGRHQTLLVDRFLSTQSSAIISRGEFSEYQIPIKLAELSFLRPTNKKG